jgi:hypothetical protein
MNDQDIAAFDSAAREPGVDIGRPVEWMVDPENRARVLGVTYEFTKTGDRKTVWYTPNKRRAKSFVVVRDLSEAVAAPVRP